MFQLDHIAAALAPKGGDNHVFDAGRTLADAAGSKLSVVSVLPSPVLVNRGLTTMEMEFDPEEIKAATDAIEDRSRDLGIEARHLHIVRGGKATAAAEWANENDVGVICAGIHKRDGFEHFVGTTATGLLRHADSAILGCHASRSLTLKKILVAVDIDEHLDSLLEQTATLLKVVTNADVYFMSAFRPIDPYVSKLNSSMIHSFAKQAREAKLTEIDEHLSRAAIDYKDLEVKMGIPSAAIKTQAEKLGVDLVVMSTGKHLGFGWHTGSTANNVMHGIQTNVLTLRSRSEA